jgi:hypothetical protein
MSEKMMESKFDLAAFSFSSRKGLIQMTRVAEMAERYEDMCEFMTKLVNDYHSEKPLSVEERNLLSVAFKNVIGSRRAAWRNLSTTTDETMGTDGGVGKKLIETYQSQLEDEIKLACSAILDLLQQKLIKEEVSADDDEGDAQVFFLKMAGDYYRYLAESITNDDEFKTKTSEFYRKAMELATKKLAATSPIRLGLALNYSVCKYEILKEPKDACEMARNAFDQAIAQLDQLKEDDYKDSTLIMQLLRDNLTLWTASSEEDEMTCVDVEN